MTAISTIYRLLSQFVAVLLLISGVGFAVGCQKQTPPPRSTQDTSLTPRQTYLEHTVKYSGETLGIIAKWYTGNANNWRAISAANPGLRPDRIRLGQLILIPQDLVTQSNPLPARNVRGLAAETKAVAKQIGDSAEKEAAATQQGAVAESAPAARTIDEDLKELEALDNSVKTSPNPTVAPEAAPSEGAVAPAAEVKPSEASAGIAPAAESAPAVTGAEAKEDAKAGAGSGAQTDDVERERLLDELLQQQ